MQTFLVCRTESPLPCNYDFIDCGADFQIIENNGSRSSRVRKDPRATAFAGDICHVGTLRPIKHYPICTLSLIVVICNQIKDKYLLALERTATHCRTSA